MAKKKSDKSPQDTDDKRSNSETARRIWLAGIGAYGRAFSEAQEALKDVTGSTSKVFDELVMKGEFIETAVSSKSKDMMKKAGVPNFDLDERIKKMRSRLSKGDEAAEDISALEARMDAMDAKLDQIIVLLKASQKPARKTATTKRTTKKS